MELTKEDWHLILEEDFKRCGEKYDTLKVLSVHKHDGNKIRVNYRTTEGDWSTGFGVMDVDKKDIPSLIREVKIKKILSK
jgi:hypothetical protein